MNRRPAAALAVLVCAWLGCRSHQPPPASKGDGGVGSAPRPTRGRWILQRLASEDEETALAARAELRKWTDDRAPSKTEAIDLLRGSAGAFARDAPDGVDTPSLIMEVLLDTPRAEYRPVIEEVFPRLGRSAREGALSLLSVIDDEASAKSFMRLLRAHAAELSEDFSLQPLRDHRHHADVFFPGLLDLAKQSSLAWEIYMTTTDFCQGGELAADKLAPRAGSLLAAYRAERDWLRPRQQPRGVGWMWAEDYQKHRSIAALLLDIAGCLPAGEAVDGELGAALGLRDPRLVYFALTSLLAHHRPLPAPSLDAVAASAEMRNALYDKLAEGHQEALFPARYRTQPAFAESNMVRWLIYPTELGRVPDKIELKKIVALDTKGPEGFLDYYVFRFRTLPPHETAKDGWIAGVAGPFLRKDAPTTDAQGGTFSEFERWDARTPEEHVGDMQELLEQWRQRQEEKSGAEKSE
jgi:hypothetical protein